MPLLVEQIPCRSTFLSLDVVESEHLGSCQPRENFQPDFLVRCLKDMLPFIEPDDVQTLAHLALKKNLVSKDVKEDIEAMYESVTHQQKFRYLMWDMYMHSSWGDFSRPLERHSSSVGKFVRLCSKVKSSTHLPFKMDSSVEEFLRLIATLPSGKSLAHDYKSKSAHTKITNFFKKKKQHL